MDDEVPQSAQGKEEPVPETTENATPKNDDISAESANLGNTPVVSNNSDAVSTSLVETVVTSQPTSENITPLRYFESPPPYSEDDTRSMAKFERSMIGPPPSYYSVMKEKSGKTRGSSKFSDTFVPPHPPPTYSAIHGVYVNPETRHCDRIYSIPSYADPQWRPHSQPAVCSRCGILVLTSVHTHDSVATHVAALALCLFGCWPCCLLPYCMSVCKNNYHHCPLCQSFLGAYTPW